MTNRVMTVTLCVMAAGAWGQCEEGWDDRFVPGFGIYGGRAIVTAGPDAGPMLGNRMFIGGNLLAAEKEVGGVVEWTGTTWISTELDLLDSPDDRQPDSVWTLCVGDIGDGPRLFAGGQDIFGENHLAPLAQWDGQDWLPIGGELDIRGTVGAVLTYDDGSGPALYIAGMFFWDIEPFVPLARYRNGTFEPVGEYTDEHNHGGFFTLVTHDDGTGTALYAGGFFDGIGGVDAAGIARWDGQAWHSVGDSLWDGPDIPGIVRDLLPMIERGQPRLYARGSFAYSGENQIRSGIAVWDGSEWQDGLVDLPFYPYEWEHFMTEKGPVFLILGRNSRNDPMRIAINHGEGWEILPGGFDGGIEALGLNTLGGSESVYVVGGAYGHFTHIDDLPADGFARFGCPRCPADFDADGDADPSDFSAFLDLWTIDDAAADFNRDGSIDTRDLTAYLIAWAEGC